MRRRKFCRDLALGVAAFSGTISQDFAVANRADFLFSKFQYRWVILYWMPYDNDLVRYGEPIIRMLTDATRDSKTLVVVQSDYWGAKKMRRRQIRNGLYSELPVSGEDSSNIANFAAYLDWAHQTFIAENWAIMIVGHGGKIDELSPDDHGTDAQARTWIKVDELANVISQFNQTTNQKVELLFLQNCQKGLLEVAYEMRNCARYTLASQLNLGAPNYYYEGFLKSLKDAAIGGREAAIAIMNAETLDMYHSLTLIDNQAMDLASEKLAALVQQFLKSSLPPTEPAKLLTSRYFGEQHSDLLMFLNYLVKVSGQGQRELNEFTEFWYSSVIAADKTGGELYGLVSQQSQKLKQLCGLSLYFPEKAQEIDRYRSLALYQVVDLVGLYRKIVTH